MHARQAGGSWFNVLVLCEDGTTVAPLVAAVLRTCATERQLDWSIVAAGTSGADGRPWPARTDTLLQRIDPSAAQSTSIALTDGLIDSADLILTATIADRRFVVGYDPATMGKTFTVRQFARFADVLPTDALSPDRRAGFDLLNEATTARAHLQPARAGEDDLANPGGKGWLQYRRSFSAITREVNRLMRPIAKTPTTGELSERQSA